MFSSLKKKLQHLQTYKVPGVSFELIYSGTNPAK